MKLVLSLLGLRPGRHRRAALRRPQPAPEPLLRVGGPPPALDPVPDLDATQEWPRYGYPYGGTL